MDTNTIAPPEGFVLESPSVPPPPAGFVLEGESPVQQLDIAAKPPWYKQIQLNPLAAIGNTVNAAIDLPGKLIPSGAEPASETLRQLPDRFIGQPERGIAPLPLEIGQHVIREGLRMVTDPTNIGLGLATGGAAAVSKPIATGMGKLIAGLFGTHAVAEGLPQAVGQASVDFQQPDNRDKQVEDVANIGFNALLAPLMLGHAFAKPKVVPSGPFVEDVAKPVIPPQVIEQPLALKQDALKQVVEKTPEQAAQLEAVNALDQGKAQKADWQAQWMADLEKQKQATAPVVEPLKPVEAPLVLGEKGAENTTAFLHDLKAAAKATKSAQEKGAMTPEQAVDFGRRGDELHAAVTGGKMSVEAARQQASNLWKEAVEVQKAKPAEVPLVAKPQEAVNADIAKQLGTLGKGKRRGESGAVIFIPDEVYEKALGFAKTAKVEAGQLYNRLRNKLGPDSSTWKMLDTPEFKSFMASGKKSTEEVKKWVDENGPRVEVRKFSADYTPEQQKVYERKAQIQHELDTRFPGWTDLNLSNYNPAARELRNKLNDAEKAIDLMEKTDAGQTSKWQSIAPKSESDMPDYVEIAVVKPLKRKPTSADADLEAEGYPEQVREAQGEQFPSSHSFPPNTLGFVRGYMETLPNGEKAFHVIEVQSDWAQRWREEEANVKKQLQENQQNAQQGQPQHYGRNRSFNAVANDPLLHHYERLALKAAIDHAREQGAKHVIVSDAETAMMSEGHDRGYAYRAKKTFDTVEQVNQEAAKLKQYKVDYVKEGNTIYVSNPRDATTLTQMGYEWKPTIPQAEGMRLHYDRTMPKIMEELTGGKGSRVEMGEHKMAFGYRLNDEQWRVIDSTGRSIRTFVGNDAYSQAVELSNANPNSTIEPGINNGPLPTRKNLIFRNADNTPKTSVSGLVYSLDKAKKDFSLTGTDKPAVAEQPKGINPKVNPKAGETGAVNLGIVKEAYDKVKEALTKEHESPTMDALKDIFTKDYMRSVWLRQAGTDAPRTTAADPVTAEHLIRYASSHVAADAVGKSMATDVLGSHYQDKAYGQKLGGVIVEDILREIHGIDAEAQGPRNTLIGRPDSPFKTEAEYQAALHNPDIVRSLEAHKETVQRLAERQQRALGGNIAAPGKETGAFANLVAIFEGDEAAAKEFVSGKPPRGDLAAQLKKKSVFNKERKGTAARYELDYRTLAERMVRGNYAEVAKQALYKAYEKSGLGKVLPPGSTPPKGFVKFNIERKGTAPGVTKVENLWVWKDVAPELSQALQTDSRITKGALGVVADLITKAQVSLGVDAGFHTANMLAAVNGAVRPKLGKNIFGAREVDTIKRVATNVMRAMQDTPEFQREIATIAKLGMGRPEHDTGLSPGAWAIKVVDRAGRVTLNQLYSELVNEKLVKNTAQNRRAFVTGQLGQYNTRLMTKFQQTAREIGVSPFVVAGKTFNRLAVQRLMLSPAVKAANPTAWVKMRAMNAVGMLTAVAVLPITANMLLTGKPMGRPGTKVGQIDTGKDDSNGRHIVVDPLQWMMLRRGLRLTGAQAVIEGVRDNAPAKDIAGTAMRDIIQARMHPYEGPAVRVGEEVIGNLRDKKPINATELVGEINPAIGAVVKGHKEGDIGESVVEQFGSAVGLKTTQSSLQRINQLARQFKTREGQPGDQSYGESPYLGLVSALRKGDTAKAKEEYKELTKTKAGKLVDEYFKDFSNKAYTGQKDREKRFVEFLAPDDKKLYEEVKASNEAVQNAYFSMLGRPVPVSRRRRVRDRSP